MFEQLSPGQKQALKFGAPLVAAVAIGAKLAGNRAAAAAPTPAPATGTIQVPTTDAIGVAQLADFESSIIDALAGVQRSIESGVSSPNPVTPTPVPVPPVLTPLNPPTQAPLETPVAPADNPNPSVFAPTAPARWFAPGYKPAVVYSADNVRTLFADAGFFSDADITAAVGEPAATRIARIVGRLNAGTTTLDQERATIAGLPRPAVDLFRMLKVGPQPGGFNPGFNPFG